MPRKKVQRDKNSLTKSERIVQLEIELTLAEEDRDMDKIRDIEDRLQMLQSV